MRRYWNWLLTLVLPVLSLPLSIPLPGEAINRLKKFFPIAETDTVIGVLQASPNEGRAVKRLLELGYPLRKIPIPRA